MDTLDITPERFQQALSWMNGKASTLGEKEVLQLLRSMTDRFQANCRTLRPGPVARFRNLSLKPHPLSLTAIMAEAEKNPGSPEGGPAPCRLGENPYLKELLEDSPSTGRHAGEATPCEGPSSSLTPEQEVLKTVAAQNRLDSVLLLEAIAHVAASAGRPLTQSRAQIILYCLYGARLGAGEERLPIERPQMWRYGPVFPRAYKKSDLEDRAACEGAYQSLLESSPLLLSALIRKTEAMMATPMADLNAVHKSAGSPYGKTRARCPEKWGTPIPDEEIAAFFRSRRTG